MATEQFTNNAFSSLVGSISPTDTTITVMSSTMFPTVPQFRVVVDDEIMLVTAVAGAVFTVTRAAETALNGGPAVAHTAGTPVYHFVTAGALLNVITGPAGTPGTKFRDGAGVPSNALGINGDLYLNVANGDVYEKAGGVYSVTGNIKGPTGATGANGATGATGATGAGVPTGGTANQVLAKIDAANYNTQWVTPSGGGGGTPAIIEITQQEWQTIQGSITKGWDTAPTPNGAYIFNNTGAIHDAYGTSMYLPAGTFSFFMNSIVGGNRGIATLFVDGVSQGTFDFYNAIQPTTYQTWTIAGITLAAGIHSIVLKCDTKNALATAFLIITYACAFIQTA